MELINSIRDLEENLLTLEKYKESDDYRYVKFYKDLIKRGRCFGAYKKNGQYLFAPSRFIGYKNNNMEDHLANDEKDGKETNPVIDKMIGMQSEPVKLSVRLLTLKRTNSLSTTAHNSKLAFSFGNFPCKHSPLLRNQRKH